MARNVSVASGMDMYGDMIENNSIKKTADTQKAAKTETLSNDGGMSIIPTTGEVVDSISPYPSQEKSEYPTIILGPQEYKGYYDSIRKGMKKNKTLKTKRMTLIATDENYDYLFFESKKRGLTMQEFANEIIAKYSVSKEGHVLLRG